MKQTVIDQLPTNVVPSHYDLTLRTDLLSLTFTGTNVITLNVLEPTSSITFHIAEPIKLSAVSYSPLAPDGALLDAVQARVLEYDERRQRMKVTFVGPELGVGEGKLALAFEGTLLLRSGTGYFGAVDSAEGEKYNYALTSFQPLGARKAFPCFDEPRLKVTVAMKHIARSGDTCIANGKILGTESAAKDGELPRTDILTDAFYGSLPASSADQLAQKLEEWEVLAPAVQEEAGWAMTSFATMPRMSSYLIAFACGRFSYLESSYTSPLTQRVIPIRAYAIPSYIIQAGEIVSTTEKVMPLYETLTEIAFPLDKIDTFVADDHSGAIENWGLVIGNAATMLVDPVTGGVASRFASVGVQAHELMHQWTGDIVTMDWHNNTWLNEAFATYFAEVVAVDRIEPTWKASSAFIYQGLEVGLKLDALRSSHPIIIDLPSEEGVGEAFSQISYKKGGSVLRMLDNFVGFDTFRDGVSRYLKAHVFGTAVADDVWKGVSEAAGFDVGPVMRPWVSKVGFPFVTVEETAHGLTLTQNRFLAGGKPTEEENETLWSIPLNLKTIIFGNPSTNHSLLMTTRSLELKQAGVEQLSFKLNADTASPFRVLYSPARLARLAKETDTFSLDDRIGLVQDAFAFAQAGYAHTSGALSLVAQIAKKEKENTVWQAIAVGLNDLLRAWLGRAEHPALVRWGRRLFKNLARELGTEGSKTDSFERGQLRSTTVRVSAKTGNKAVIRDFFARFERYKAGEKGAVPEDLRTAIFQTVVKHGGERELDYMISLFKNPTSGQDMRTSALYGMGAASSAATLDRVLGLIKAQKFARIDLPALFGGMSDNSLALARLLDLVEDAWETVIGPLLGGKGFSSTYTVGVVFAGLNTESQIARLEKFMRDKDTTAYATALGQVYEKARINAGWAERDAADVAAWLEQNGGAQKVRGSAAPGGRSSPPPAEGARRRCEKEAGATGSRCMW